MRECFFSHKGSILSSSATTTVRACLNETLRLFPSVPTNQRASMKATTLPRASPSETPFYMPGPYTPISYFPILMHRRKDLWGEDADDFKPERWLDEKRVMELTKDPFRFLPFNAGPRICLGQVSHRWSPSSHIIL